MKNSKKEFDPKNQIGLLHDLDNQIDFKSHLKEENLYPLKSEEIEAIDLSITYRCNQECRHCSVMSSPNREEMMDEDILKKCLKAINKYDITTTELTGGAPELHPRFKWLINKLGNTKTNIILRTNLTALNSSEEIIKTLKVNKATIHASFPHYEKEKIRTQRGKNVYEKSVSILKKLNRQGYGNNDELELNLVYNPLGTELPLSESELEKKFKRNLKKKHGINFKKIYTLTNMPIGRFLKHLVEKNILEDYIKLLSENFNPKTLKEVMCKKIISVDPNGNLYDCGFNQSLNLPLKSSPKTIDGFNRSKLENREINIDNHCYGCTAAAGSTCYRS